MKHGKCTIAAKAIRREPSERSEMISQLVFGELFTIVETESNWLKILIDFDGYEGWIDQQQIELLSEDDFEKLRNLPAIYCDDAIAGLKSSGQNFKIPIYLGSDLRCMTDENKISMKGNDYIFEGSSIVPATISLSSLHNCISKHMPALINSPYLWGGKTPFGIDCSGLNQLIYKLSGFVLSRDASMQAQQGETIAFISDAQPGDLLFFDNDDGEITHTGIFLEKDTILHASGKVRIDKIDHQGIFDSEEKKYTHKLRLIKRIIS